MEGDEGPDRRCVMVASCVHGRVGAFYAPCAGDGNQILQMKSVISVEPILDIPVALKFLKRKYIS